MGDQHPCIGDPGGDRKLRSSQLRFMTCALRNLSCELRTDLAARPELLKLPALAVQERLKEVRRSAREVEAWGAELFDACALAAAAEAHFVVALVRKAIGEPRNG